MDCAAVAGCQTSLAETVRAVSLQNSSCFCFVKQQNNEVLISFPTVSTFTEIIAGLSKDVCAL